MNNTIAVVAAETSQSFQKCKAFKNQLLAEIEKDRSDLKKIEVVTKYTAQIKKEKARLEAQIKDKLLTIKDVEIMMGFKPGDWVRNGNTRPGEVVDLVIAGRVPEVHVLWWNNTVAVPERPRLLTLIEPYQLEYIWDGQNYPKLIRRIDRFECEDLEVLKKKYELLLNSKVEDSNPEIRDREIVYCKKRITHLTENKKKQIDKILDFCSHKPEIKKIPINKIKRDGGTQQRVGLKHETVIEYAEAMQAGDRFPPVKLKYDGESYWLTDGFHTTEAAWSIGQTEIEASIGLGTLRDAILDSVAVNANHGLRRTNADKRRAVMTLLEDQEWQQWSNREIARHTKVSESLVRSIKKDLSLRLNAVTIQDKHGNITAMHTENIGNKKEVEQMNGCLEYAPEDLPAFNKNDNLENDKKNLTEDFPSDNPKTYKDKYENDSPTPLINNFKVNQIVKITSNSDRSDKRLVGLKNSLALVTAINPSSVDLKLFGQTLTAVSPSDIQPLDQSFEPTICICLNQNDFRTLISNFNSIEQITKAAIDNL